MAFIFPEDKNDFTAPNGIIYRWDGNKWAVKAFRSTEDFIVELGDDPPDTPKEGDLWYDTKEEELTLYIWTGKVWVPAAPPVSLDGIESSITGIEGDLIELHNNVRQVRGDIVLTNQDLQALAQDQIRQDGQIATLEEEIEQLAPALERGAWSFVSNDNPEPGEYTIIRDKNQDGLDQCNATHQECLIENAGDPIGQAQCNRDLDDCKALYNQAPDPDFSKAYVLQFNRKDAEGVDHKFPDVKKDTVIDIFNDSDDSFCIAIAHGEVNVSSNYVLMFVDVSQSRGFADGLGRVKVFEAAEVDTTNYIRKSGDTMTGKLEINKPLQSSNTNSFVIKGRVNGKIKALFKDYRRQESSEKSDYIEYFGSTASDDSIASKKTIQGWINASLAAPARFSWEFHTRTNGTEENGPSSGTFHNDGDWYLFSFITAEGVNLNAAPTTSRPEGDWGPHLDDQFLMTFWRKSGANNWSLVTHFECNKVHWGCEPDTGAVHFKFRRRWDSHGSATSSEPALLDNETYFVTVGGFF